MTVLIFSSTIERTVVHPSRTPLRLGLADLQRAEIGSFSAELLVDRRYDDPGVDSFAACFQPEIQIRRMIHGVPLRGIGRSHLLKHIEVDLDAMSFVASGFAKLGKS